MSEEAALLRKRINAALEIAWRYGQIDGDHHKLWVIDQMVRSLTDSGYSRWIVDYEASDGGDEYIWDEGVPP